MSYIWTPESGELVVYRDNRGTGFSATVVVEGEEEPAIDPITGEETGEMIQQPHPNTFSVSGLSSVVNFSTSGNTWTVSVSAEEALALFPIRITYLLTRYKESMGVVYSWEDVPSNAEEIIKLETIASTPYVDYFTVTASVGGSEPETKSYSIKIVHVYTANADRLKLEVDKRRTHDAM